MIAATQWSLRRPWVPRALRLIVLGFLLCLASPDTLSAGGAKAKSPGDKAKSEHGETKPSEPGPTDPRVVDLPVVVCPVTDQGTLKGYLYLGVRLMAKDPATAEKLKHDLPLIQDAALRALHAAPIGIAEADGPGASETLAARLAAAIAGRLGEGLVASVTVRDSVKAPFHGAAP